MSPYKGSFSLCESKILVITLVNIVLEFTNYAEKSNIVVYEGTAITFVAGIVACGI